MTPDMDLLRDILLLAAEQPSGLVRDYSSLGRDGGEVFQHVRLLMDEGWVEANESHAMSGSFAMITRVTASGQNVIANIRDGAMWEEAKTRMQQKSIPMTMDNMRRMLAKLVDEKFG